jgi:hypothetical protein
LQKYKLFLKNPKSEQKKYDFRLFFSLVNRIFANEKSRIGYGTESEQELEIVLLHQGGGRNVRPEREYPALFGDGVSLPETQDQWACEDTPVSGEGH